METWEVVIFSLLVLAVICCISMLIGDSIREKIRRKKHPKWYALYDLALKNSLDIGAKFRNKADSINKRRELVQELYFNGECTEDEYNEAMKTLAKEYSAAVKWFKLIKEELCIDADLKEADAYAKEHNLKWGIIYENSI